MRSAWASELAGTTYGFPFGAYEYTALMEPKWFGRVPIVIPLSWFYMAVASYALAGRVRGSGSGKVAARIVVAAVALTAWEPRAQPGHESPGKLTIALGVFYLTALHPWLAPLVGGSSNLMPLFLLTAVRACEAALVGTPLRALLLHPFGALGALAITFRSAWVTHRGSAVWAGRLVSPASRQ